MIDNPLLIILIIVGLFIFFLAIFVFFTYLILKLASDLKREEMKNK